MGAFVSVFAWAVPLTVLNIFTRKQNNKIGDGSENNSLPPIYGHVYPPPSADYKAKYKSEENADPPKTYKLATLHGRTSYFPVDPYFKALNPKAMKTRCPRFDLELVFKETQQSLMKNCENWTSQATDFKDTMGTGGEGDKTSSQTFEKNSDDGQDVKYFTYDQDYQNLMTEMRLHEGDIPGFH